MAKQITKILTALILAGTINVPIVYAVDYGISNPPPQYGTNDPGVQLNRTREYMERQRVARQIAEDRAKQRAEVEGSGQEQQQASENAVKFVLNDVKIDKSEVLAETEIKEITGKYIGQEVTLQSLYDIVNSINELYSEKGYLTGLICRRKPLKTAWWKLKLLKVKPATCISAAMKAQMTVILPGASGLTAAASATSTS